MEISVKPNDVSTRRSSGKLLILKYRDIELYFDGKNIMDSIWFTAMMK